MSIADNVTLGKDLGYMKIYPDILLNAKNETDGGAIRLWSIAKHLNPGGCGAIPYKSLRKYSLTILKLKRGTFDIWISRAIYRGLITREGKNIKMASVAKVASLYGLKKISRPIYIGIARLINHGWSAYVWNGWLQSAGMMNKPRSRYVFETSSGIKPRTQLNYENKSNVINHANYAKHLEEASLENCWELKANQGRPIFLYCGKEIYERLPNTRESNIPDLKPASRGRIKRINSDLKRINQVRNLSKYGGQDSLELMRIYCASREQKKSCLAKIRKLSIQDRKTPDWIYSAGRKGFWVAERV
jgi:hypothetical protein